MTQLILYGTADCRLCEEAQGVIYQALGVPLNIIEITDDPDLLARYSLRIPVLQHATTGAELDWPFGATEVRQLYSPSSVSHPLSTASPIRLADSLSQPFTQAPPR